MFANPGNVPEQLLLLISIRPSLFGTTWLSIYNAQRSGQLPLEFGGDHYFQIEAQVVKNLTRRQFIDGIYRQNAVVDLLTKQGGASVGLHFPNCPFDFDMELKFASVIDKCSTFQVWGTNFSGCNFFTPLLKLHHIDSQGAYYTHYLHGHVTIVKLQDGCY
jgi:hypothetical protein